VGLEFAHGIVVEQQHAVEKPALAHQALSWGYFLLTFPGAGLFGLRHWRLP
jgi:hypothetical protein